MSPAERIADLEAQVAYLKSEMGLAVRADHEAKVRTKLGLQPREARLLLALNATGRIMSRDHLEMALERPNDGECPKVVDTYICRIRKALPGSIQTFRPYGYAITAQGKAALAALV